MSLIDKINYLLRLLLDDEFSISELKCGIVSKYWKIGTSIYNTFTRMYENLVSLNCTVNKIKIRLYEDKTFFEVDNIKVTPTTKSTKLVSYSAMSQYIRMFQAFNIIAIKQRFKNWNEFIDGESVIDLVFDALDKLKKKDKEFVLMLENFLANAFFQEITTTRDICLSIIIEVLIKFNFDFSYLNNTNNQISCRKITGNVNKKEQKYFILSQQNDFNKFKNDIYKQGSAGTYKEITNLVFNNYNSLEEFINRIYELVKSKTIETTEVHNKNNLASLETERVKFKKNIFNDRKNKMLIDSWEDDYTDVCDLDNNPSPLKRPFSQANACHLFEYNQIKRNVEIYHNEIDKSDVSNPHNGLIMPIEYHNSFDRRQWTFDNSGMMVYDVENEHLILDRLKLKKIKIRNEVLSEQMKEYIFKRNTN